MRRQFVLDKRTNKLLEELASYRAGNRSMVVREAIQYYADMENDLDKIEADPEFQKTYVENEQREFRSLGFGDTLEAVAAEQFHSQRALPRGHPLIANNPTGA